MHLRRIIYLNVNKRVAKLFNPVRMNIMLVVTVEKEWQNFISQNILKFNYILKLI